jgi:phenylpropionate dioxygenase-like ring-hydroxylating dioxygenase large terminal subunit
VCPRAQENLFDPSHIPFAHHGIMGSASRDKAMPLSVNTVRDVTVAGAAMYTALPALMSSRSPVASNSIEYQTDCTRCK